MAGSHGVSLNDPVFGISSGSTSCENSGHRPTPAQAPIPPPPPEQRVGDPVAQLLVGQGAMSHLLIQMAQEMSRRTGGLCLIHDAYGPELKEAINSADPIRSFRDHDQTGEARDFFICFSRTSQDTARLRT